MGITHEWNGTVLTITSDSGTSSMDLQGEKGNTGPRGPQGRCGVLLDPTGKLDMSDYATEDFVVQKITEAQLSPDGEIDLSDYATKYYVDSVIKDIEVDVDLTGYATEAYVQQEIAKINVSGGGSGGNVDLSNYYTKSEVDTKIANVDVSSQLTNYALKSEIPDVSAYQTEAQVLALIQANIPNYVSGDEVSY